MISEYVNCSNSLEEKEEEEEQIYVLERICDSHQDIIMNGFYYMQKISFSSKKYRSNYPYQTLLVCNFDTHVCVIK